jgi:hypothetical protein
MTSAQQLRDELRARVADEALADPRVKTLERWALGQPDEHVAEAIELFMIGLDASRQGRFRVLRTIDDEFREPDALLPHEDRVAFLRWIVRSRETDSKIQAKLLELRMATTRKARSGIITTLTAAEGENATSMENAHGVLVYAWRAAPAEARPPGPVHRGEPEPFIGARNTVRLVVYFARRVAHLVPRNEKKAFERLLRLAVTSLGAARSNESLREAIMEASTQAREGAMSLARSACVVASTALARPDMVGTAARPAATKVVGLLLEADGNDAVRNFLADVDEELRRLDVAHALDTRKKSPSRPIVRAIHRAAEKGQVMLWLAELEGGQLGLLAKQGRRWAWTEGTRDDILAMIPDAHFEAAVMAAK